MGVFIHSVYGDRKREGGRGGERREDYGLCERKVLRVHPVQTEILIR